MARQDFLIGPDGDLLIKNGDLVIGLSDEKHIEDYLMSAPGSYKQYPEVGVGLVQQLDGGHTRSSLDVLKRRIQLQLQGDGMKVNNVRIMLDGAMEIQSISVNQV